MYQLFFKPGACSMAVHVALNEIGVPFEAKPALTPDGKGTNPEFLKFNPRGKVPVLIDDDFVLREGGAILTYLLDKHGKTDLLPRDGHDRARALEWLMWANSTLHPAYGRAFWINTTVTDANLKKTLLQECIKNIETLWVEVDQHLGKTPFLAGKQITIGDILMTVIANWSDKFGVPVRLGDNVKRVLRAVIARPSYQKALNFEKIEYKVAA